MTRGPIITITAITLVLASQAISASDDDDHHLPHNHIALVVAAAFEEQADGHRERGNMLGLEYVRQVTEHWGWGAAIEMEAFGDSNDRLGVLVLPVSYFPNDRWRLLAGAGVEFRERGEREHALLRAGAG